MVITEPRGNAMIEERYDAIVIGTSQGGRFLPVELAKALARAHGNDDRYRDYRDRYRDLAFMPGFEGHIAWADEMP